MSRTSPSTWRSPPPRRPAPSAAPTPAACTAGTPAGSTTCPVSAGACGSSVAVRRFVCPRSDCPRRIFAERLPGFAAPRARTTDRLRQTQTDIGSSLGGEAGSRLAARMGMATSPDTLLRRVKRLKNEPAGPPRVVGIDDWAWRKGQRYGTIVVDLERSDVIDLLPDRDADTVAAWLKAHPGVEVVSRDRSAAYAQAATEGASQAGQVADRWHLLKNLREAVERVLERHSAAINAALKALEAPPGPDRDRDSPPDRRGGTGCRTAPAWTAGRAGPGVATTPGQAGETSGAGRAVRASPRAPQARLPGRPDRPGTGPVAEVRVPVPAARDVPRLAPPGVAPVAAGRVPGVDRRPDRRGLHERRRLAPAVDRTRLPRVVRQRLRVRHEAARRGREEAGAPQRGRLRRSRGRRRQGSSPSSGPADRRNASLPNRHGSTPSAAAASSWPRRWTWRTGSPI